MSTPIVTRLARRARGLWELEITHALIAGLGLWLLLMVILAGVLLVTA